MFGLVIDVGPGNREVARMQESLAMVDAHERCEDAASSSSTMTAARELNPGRRRPQRGCDRGNSLRRQRLGDAQPVEAGEPFVLSRNGLPASPEGIRARELCIVHSVRADTLEQERRLRAEHAGLTAARQGAKKDVEA